MVVARAKKKLVGLVTEVYNSHAVRVVASQKLYLTITTQREKR